MAGGKSMNGLRFMPRILDGGTGTELERRGVPMNGFAWSAEAVLSHPEVLREVHASFLDAGADMVIANTFSTALHNLERAGLGSYFREINGRAVELAKQAAFDTGSDALVAGAISTTTFSGALDYSQLADGQQAVSRYSRQAEVQVQAGAELIVLEMMRDITQTSLALEGADSQGVPVWLGFSCEPDDTGVPVLMDTDIPLARALDEVPLERAHAVGIMHTLVEHARPALERLRSVWKGPVFCYPHAGRFEMPNWIFQDIISPQDFAELGLDLLRYGVDCVGGCCGITPGHIRALRHRLDCRED